ncbi:hypothetical protein HDV01_003050 [Terramyces sp. JEL0728]|nr:hypothetical protein HDV01_003050 [Terramyces sp. JEL0728]
MRNTSLSAGKSINLTLAQRGIEGLKGVGLEYLIGPDLIALKGRYIHSSDGNFQKLLYGIAGENERIFETADLIVGADGAYSKIREVLNRKVRMNYSQEYIDHLYVELRIPATETGYALDSDRLHIWPRKTFLMIACPNLDKSFTVTLFMPKDKFNSIQTPPELLDFFKENFADALDLIGPELLVDLYFSNPKCPLISVKCAPYHYEDKAVIIGDAAHAMVPFFGQGMNCGFEDVLVLTNLFKKHVPSERAPTKQELSTILTEFTNTRKEDCQAICDLAQQNYLELRSGVTDPKYYARKQLETTLQKWFPNIMPLYTMVSFTTIPYSQALKRNKRQTLLFEYFWAARGVLKLSAVGVCGVVAYSLIRKIIQ